MPRYDYRCEECGAHETVTHGFHDEGPHNCFVDTCNGTMKKVISPIPTVFKTGGFYKTDSR